MFEALSRRRSRAGTRGSRRGDACFRCASSLLGLGLFVALLSLLVVIGGVSPRGRHGGGISPRRLKESIAVDP